MSEREISGTAPVWLKKDIPRSPSAVMIIIAAAIAVTNFYKSMKAEQERDIKQRDIINPRID